LLFLQLADLQALNRDQEAERAKFRQEKIFFEQNKKLFERTAAAQPTQFKERLEKADSIIRDLEQAKGYVEMKLWAKKADVDKGVCHLVHTVAAICTERGSKTMLTQLRVSMKQFDLDTDFSGMDVYEISNFVTKQMKSTQTLLAREREVSNRLREERKHLQGAKMLQVELRAKAKEDATAAIQATKAECATQISQLTALINESVAMIYKVEGMPKEGPLSAVLPVLVDKFNELKQKCAMPVQPAQPAEDTAKTISELEARVAKLQEELVTARKSASQLTNIQALLRRKDDANPPTAHSLVVDLLNLKDKTVS
jgi:predicted secreted protein